MKILLPEQLPYSSPADPVVDLAGVHPFAPHLRYRPPDKGALLDAIRRQRTSEIRALGSAWSLSAITEAASVIDTMFLRYHLSPPYGARSSLAPSRMRAESGGVLNDFCQRNHAQANGRQFIHVESGIKIWMLLDDLKSCGLALPTMGAGGGQSLAGALSTGTHGADFATTPLVDWVRAVHLVNASCEEWWITPSESPFTGTTVLKLPDWPLSGQILANDQVFDAVRVAAGRMGVIYAFILEVVPSYSLIEVSHTGGAVMSESVRTIRRSSGPGDLGQIFTDSSVAAKDWSNIRTKLQSSGVVDGKPVGLFDCPVTNLRTGWLWHEVVKPSVDGVLEALRAHLNFTVGEASADSVRPSRPSLSVAMWVALGFYGGLSADRQGALLEAQATPLIGEDLCSELAKDFGLIDYVIRQMGLELLESQLSNDAPKPLRHLNVMVSLAAPDVCWVTRRWAVPDCGPINMTKPEPSEIDQILREDINNAMIGAPRNPLATLQFFSNYIRKSARHEVDQLADFWFPVTPLIKHVGKSHLLEPLSDFLEQETARICEEFRAVDSGQLGQSVYGWSSEAIFLLIYRLATRSPKDVREEMWRPINSVVTNIVGANAFINPVPRKCE